MSVRHERKNGGFIAFLAFVLVLLFFIALLVFREEEPQEEVGEITQNKESEKVSEDTEDYFQDETKERHRPYKKFKITDNTGKDIFSTISIFSDLSTKHEGDDLIFTLEVLGARLDDPNVDHVFIQFGEIENLKMGIKEISAGHFIMKATVTNEENYLVTKFLIHHKPQLSTGNE